MAEPETVQDHIIAWGQEKHGEMESASAREDFEGRINLALATLQRYPVLDYHIVPGAKVVVTQKGLENAAKALSNSQKCWGRLCKEHKAHWLQKARAALKAAGIQVVDEVVRVNSAGPEDIPVLTMDDESVYITLHVGDKLYIQRGEISDDED